MIERHMVLGLATVQGHPCASPDGVARVLPNRADQASRLIAAPTAGIALVSAPAAAPCARQSMSSPGCLR